ncbi:hypothetical protein [Halioglobus sp. HI00S01]|uniref:hypothetical protein n=1 Tax=Halioglobus sp. HI00S01 TaxID=1822214 RepID=UPI000AC6BD39|nr:hypothetical protein [Halioglobus sp. HI00S01]
MLSVARPMRIIASAGIALCFTGTAHSDTSDSEKESPWLLTPTVSADPKLGTTLGAVAGYIHKFDSESAPSLITSFGTYSDTDSYVGGVYGDTYFGADEHKLMFGYVNGKIRNEYDDFLGTGVSAKTEDNIESLFARYLNRIGDSHWYIGGQLIMSDYVVGADGIFDRILEQIGLTGFQSNGIGLVAELDDRDHNRNPTSGQHLVAYNVAYREGLGGEESFDSLQVNYSHYLKFGAKEHVLATNARGRWTHDAPTSGFSSLNMRGYTRGNYLGEHYSHINLDARFNIKGRWGASLFGGLGCLYSKVSACDDSDNLFPMLGAGIIFDLKPDAGIVLRLEYAAGKDDNEGYYLSLGQPF